MSIGDKIRTLRKANGYTQEELGSLIGIKKSAVAKYENNRVENLKRATIQKLADVLHVSPSYFFEEEILNPDDVDLDHIIPISLKTKKNLNCELFNSPVNLQFISREANLVKGNSIEYKKLGERIIEDENLLETVLLFGFLSNSNKQKLIDYCYLLYNSQEDTKKINQDNFD